MKGEVVVNSLYLFHSVVEYNNCYDTNLHEVVSPLIFVFLAVSFEVNTDYRNLAH